MKKLIDLLWILQGFNVCYNGEVYTTTLWARFIRDAGIKQGKFRKLGKNHYKHIRKRERINKSRQRINIENE